MDRGEDDTSTEHVVHGTDGEKDPLEGIEVPGDFDETVFNPAFQSVRYMVWTETWQRFMSWKNKGGVVEAP